MNFKQACVETFKQIVNTVNSKRVILSIVLSISYSITLLSVLTFIAGMVLVVAETDYNSLLVILISVVVFAVSAFFNSVINKMYG